MAWPIPLVGPLPEDPAEGAFMGGVVGAGLTQPGRALVGRGYQSIKGIYGRGAQLMPAAYNVGAGAATGFDRVVGGVAGAAGEVLPAARGAGKSFSSAIAEEWGIQAGKLGRGGLLRTLGVGGAIGAGVGAAVGWGFSSLRSNQPYR